MDKEDFQAWKDSPATRFVLAALQGKATDINLMCRDRLFNSTQGSPEDWAALQARASFDAGYVKAIEELVQLEHKDVEDSNGEDDRERR